MDDITIRIMNNDSKIIGQQSGEHEVNLLYQCTYQSGDRIQVVVSTYPAFYWMQLDDAIGSHLVYLCDEITEYIVPFDERRLNQSPKAFNGEKHLISVKLTKDYEVPAYRNLALNPYDQHQMKTMFPHVVANVETRGEVVFAAQNAINGITINNSHGDWPFSSWGINRQDDACMTVEFGREVCIDRIRLYTRADFPHDNWWKQVTFSFSDQSTLVMTMEKDTRPHEITFESKTVTWVKLQDMRKDPTDPSPFPALTEIQVYGTEK